MTDTAPALGVSFNFKIDDRREIVVQTHMARDASQREIDGMLDKVRTALERQKTISDLADFRAKLKYDLKKLDQLKEDFARVEQRHNQAAEESNRRGQYKLGAKEQADRQNALSTIDRYELEIKLDRENIAECEAKLATESKEEPKLRVV